MIILNSLQTYLYKLMTEVQKGIFLSYVITTLKKAGVNTVPYIGY